MAAMVALFASVINVSAVSIRRGELLYLPQARTETDHPRHEAESQPRTRTSRFACPSQTTLKRSSMLLEQGQTRLMEHREVSAQLTAIIDIISIDARTSEEGRVEVACWVELIQPSKE